MCVCVSRVCVWICMPVYVAQSLQRHLTASALTVSPSLPLPLPPSLPLPLSLYPTPICSIQTTVVVVVAPLSVLSHTVSVCLFLYSLIFICIFMRRRSLCSRCHCCCCCWYFIYFEYICEFLFTLSHSRVVVGFMQSFVATQFKTTCNWRITFSLSLYLFVSFSLLNFIILNSLKITLNRYFF